MLWLHTPIIVIDIWFQNIIRTRNAEAVFEKQRDELKPLAYDIMYLGWVKPMAGHLS